MTHDPLRSPGALISILDRHADRFARQRFQDLGVGKAHLQFIGSLSVEGDGVSQEEIAQRMAMDKSAVARSLHRLEVLQLVRRHRDPDDARRNQVYLTPRARRLWPNLLRALEDWGEILTRGMRTSERRQAIDLLVRMADNAVSHTMGADEGSAS